MKKIKWSGLALCLVLILLAGCALAGDTFRFEDKSITLFEGEKADTGLLREGACAEEGDITYLSAGEKFATVESDGTITAVSKGRTTVTARLKIGKKTWKTQMTVNVLRAVTDVTLDTTKMTVLQPDDPLLEGILKVEEDDPGDEKNPEDEENPLTDPVILLAAGKTAQVKTTVTPSSASNKKVIYTSTDEGILKVYGTGMKALQAGECDLTVASESNPEVQEHFHVIVTQPVTKITVNGEKSVFAGETTELTASCEPSTATIKTVLWSSRNPKVATVDEYGTVTGIAKGTAVIDATAADGSGKVGSLKITVAQRPTEIALKQDSLDLVAGRTGQLTATVSPANANDKTVVWSTSDPTVATVSNRGVVKAVGRGECTVTAACSADQNVTATATIRVVQWVTGITFDSSKAYVNVRSSLQLVWSVLPEDASDPGVTFSSSNEKVCIVDQFGTVTGLSKGTARIYARAVDGSGVRGQISIQVLQPVEGVSIQYPVYHVQLNGTLNIKAMIEPSNANNYAVDWTSDQPEICSVTGRGKNVGTARGLSKGVCTVTGTTQDGGFSASATVRVDEFNRAVVVDDLYLQDERIYVFFRNRSDFDIQHIKFTVYCYGQDAETGEEIPLVCNTDGVSTSFSGHFSGTLEPDQITDDFDIYFDDYVQPLQSIIGVRVVVENWTDLENYTRSIPDNEKPDQFYRRANYPIVVVTPIPIVQEDDSVG